MTRRHDFNFSAPPSSDILYEMARSLVDDLPKELDDLIDGLEIAIDDFPSEDIQSELELETDFDLLALYIDSPRKTLVLYRRPILDIWCETEDDLGKLICHLMVTELAQQLDYTAVEIEALANESVKGG